MPAFIALLTSVYREIILPVIKVVIWVLGVILNITKEGGSIWNYLNAKIGEALARGTGLSSPDPFASHNFVIIDNPRSR